MANNSMAISFSSDSDSVSFHHTPASPAATNQPEENLLLPSPQAKKPRGRPPGSKNKRKSRPSEPSVKVVIINVEPGKDVMESIIDVARETQSNLTVLSASGTIASVTLHYSPDATAATTLHGPLALLSLNGSYLYDNDNLNLHPPPLSFTIQLTTTEGQVFGGAIAGQVIAGDALTLTLSTFRLQ